MVSLPNDLNAPVFIAAGIAYLDMPGLIEWVSGGGSTQVDRRAIDIERTQLAYLRRIRIIPKI